MKQTALNKLIDFLNEEICERRDYSASKMCEVIRLKIETELLEEEKEQIINAFGNGEYITFCKDRLDYDPEDYKFSNSEEYYAATYTQSSE